MVYEERLVTQGLEKGFQGAFLEGWKEGWKEGWREGWNEGRRQGEASFLLLLLTHRFGALPEAVQARVAAADLATLDRWGDRLLTAPELASVFDDR
jgi:flagellar biosynthesis/type III secretory pathway protein FliH